VERNGFNERVQFSDEQKMFIKEYMHSKSVVDRTSRFNIRPPELIIFDNLLLFYKFFVRESKKFPKEKELTQEIQSRPWVDGLCGRWKIRRTMMNLAVSVLERKHDAGNEFALELLEFIFLFLQQ
jgi:hypothetical protein